MKGGGGNEKLQGLVLRIISIPSEANTLAEVAKRFLCRGRLVPLDKGCKTVSTAKDGSGDYKLSFSQLHLFMP